MGGREAEGCSWLPELRQWPGFLVGPAARAGGRLPVSAGGEARQEAEEKAGKEGRSKALPLAGEHAPGSGGLQFKMLSPLLGRGSPGMLQMGTHGSFVRIFGSDADLGRRKVGKVLPRRKCMQLGILKQPQRHIPRDFLPGRTDTGRQGCNFPVNLRDKVRGPLLPPPAGFLKEQWG